MARDYFALALDILTNPRWTVYLCPLLLVVELVFNALIIRTVPYTEIDWNAYMQQVKQYNAGEQDYTKIYGDTGPLVYPAMHVWIYKALYGMTSGGRSIVVAQAIFALLYVFNLALVFLCYRQANVPPWVYPMLVMSKRLHSIYVLRCFNDGFAMTFYFLSIYLFQKRQWALAASMFSFGMGVKMSMLLALPAVCVFLYQALGPGDAIGNVGRMIFIQVAIGAPFLQTNWRGYLSRAFDFSRQFLYKWTVNWKFVPEETFLSREFAIGLLVLHASLLALFITTRWLKPLKRTPSEFLGRLFEEPSKLAKEQIQDRMTPDYILTTMLSANAIGMLCARSLHYQFFAWIGWATPFLLWRSQINPILVVVLWIGQELAWLQYPANDLSSKIVVGVLAAVVVQIWIGTDDPGPSVEEQKRAALQSMMKSRDFGRRPVRSGAQAGQKST